MTQEGEDKAKEAEARTQETRSFIRRVKRKIRRKFTAEEKIRIVLEGIRTIHPSESCVAGRASHPTPTTPGSKTSWRVVRNALCGIVPEMPPGLRWRSSNGRTSSSSNWWQSCLWKCTC